MADPAKKFSFSFTKTTKKPNFSNKPPLSGKSDRQLVDCLEGKSIRVKGVEEAKEEGPLIIPLQPSSSRAAVQSKNGETSKSKSEQKTDPSQIISIKQEPQDALEAPQVLQQSDNTENTVKVKTEPLELAASSLEEMAAQEILKESDEFHKKEDKLDSLTLPAVQESDVLAADPTNEDYENIPVSAFGKAMLRGMGWQEEAGIGKKPRVVSAIEATGPKRLSSAAEQAIRAAKMGPKSAGSSEQEELQLIKGAFVKVLSGAMKGQYGEVEGFTDECDRLLVKMALRKGTVNFHASVLEVVSKSDYTKNSRVLNSSKYEEVKSKVNQSLKISGRQSSPKRSGSSSGSSDEGGGRESRGKSPSRKAKSPSSRGVSPSRRRNSPSSRVSSPPQRRASPFRRKDSPRRKRDSPTRRIDSASRRRDSPFGQRDSPSRQKDSPSRRRDSPSRRRDSPSRRRDSPSRRRDSPSRRRDSPSRQRDSPSRRKDSPSRQRDSPSRRRDSPSRRRDSPSRRGTSPSRRKDSPSRGGSRHSWRRESPSRREASPSRRKVSPPRKNVSPARRRYSPSKGASPTRRKSRSLSPLDYKSKKITQQNSSKHSKSDYSKPKLSSYESSKSRSNRSDSSESPSPQRSLKTGKQEKHSEESSDSDLKKKNKKASKRKHKRRSSSCESSDSCSAKSPERPQKKKKKKSHKKKKSKRAESLSPSPERRKKSHKK